MHKIEPYIDLSAKLGTFLAHSDINGIESLTINYAGDLAALRIAPLTQNIVKGFLQRRLGSQVNNVNASYIAERRGIVIHENKTTAARGFANLITVELKDKDGIKRVAGTLLNGLRSEEHTSELQSRGH